MGFRIPVSEMLFTMRHVGDLDAGIAEGLYGDLSLELVEAVLGEAARFSEERLVPLNRVGDKTPPVLHDGAITMPDGWRDAYRAWCQAGWNGLGATPEFGGQGLPAIVNVACAEMWNASAMAFGLGPLLTDGAVEALTVHGSDQLKATYLPNLIAGTWMGTMNLTEPQAGSDLNALRSRAERNDDGSYRVFGQKIYITYGEHDLTDNIVHLVLARLPDAPAGTRGISLFLVPKFLVNADGSLGARNDVTCTGIEHKLGIHGSPTCTMVYGDAGGATGWLIGEENRGLACMFTMMNNARLKVGIQGVAIAERALQQAMDYASERRQGQVPGAIDPAMVPIAAHPDVQRMLMTMRAMTQAARCICTLNAAALDRAHLAATPEARKAGHERASLLTPISKAFSTDIGIEMASLGVQVHGGMGFVEETGAAQHMRDARILAIYEGTNGIQAIDLVTRKLPLSGGEAVRALIGELRTTADAIRASNTPAYGRMGQSLLDACGALDRTTRHMLGLIGSDPSAALVGATPYLRLFGLTLGGCAMARLAMAAHESLMSGETDPALGARITTARYFCERLLPATAGLEPDVMTPSDAMSDIPLALAS